MPISKRQLILYLLLTVFSSTYLSALELDDPRQIDSENFWKNKIKPSFFSDKTIIQNNENALIKINAPQKAEDAAIVPISIKIDNKNISPVKTLYIFIDKNPSPLVGILGFPIANNKTDIAMRVRVNDFSFIRVIAETMNGKYYMDKSFVKAAGGCSAPAGIGSVESIGKMKTRLMGKLALSKPNLLQLKIRHPNYSGLETPLPGKEKPEPYYINNLKARLDGKLILDWKLTFSVSSNPGFRFYISPEKEGILEIEATDTKNNVFTHRHVLDHNNVSIN